jgi:hypothetical protein
MKGQTLKRNIGLQLGTEFAERGSNYGATTTTVSIMASASGQSQSIAVLRKQRVRGRSLRYGPEMPWP